jgi:hypothetical protein
MQPLDGSGQAIKPEEPDKAVFPVLRDDSNDYNVGYADGMRETMFLLTAAMLLSIFLLVRFMGEHKA